MTDIGQIDKRLAVSTSFGRDDIVMHDPRQEPFTLYGVYYDYEKGVYRRMAEEIASTVNDGVKELSIHTAGGRVCFSTDADAIAISCRRPTLWRMPHMALIGSAGFDLYIRGEDGKLTYYVRGNWPGEVAEHWGNAVVTKPVAVSEIHGWLQANPDAFIAAIR